MNSKFFSVVFILFNLVVFSVIAQASPEHLLKLPIGKSRCPEFTFKTPVNWILKSGRKKGDRWIIWDKKKNEQVARFDYNLPNVDQKQLPEVLDKEIKLGAHTVNKFIVTLAIVSEEAPAHKIDHGLITSYNYESGTLEGLKLITDSYARSSGLEEQLEHMLETIKIISKK